MFVEGARVLSFFFLFRRAMQRSQPTFGSSYNRVNTVLRWCHGGAFVMTRRCSYSSSKYGCGPHTQAFITYEILDGSVVCAHVYICFDYYRHFAQCSTPNNFRPLGLWQIPLLSEQHIFFLWGMIQQLKLLYWQTKKLLQFENIKTKSLSSSESL